MKPFSLPPAGNPISIFQVFQAMVAFIKSSEKKHFIKLLNNT